MGTCRARSSAATSMSPTGLSSGTLSVIDGFIDGAARWTIRTARFDGRFDNGVVDGMVNLVGNVTSQTDALNHTTSYVYDHLNRLLTTTDALTGVTQFTYDDAGNETEKAKSGEYWFYTYDFDNRLTYVEKRTTEAGASVLSIDFKYDIFGNRIERDFDSDGAGSSAAVALKMAYEGGNAFLDKNHPG